MKINDVPPSRSVTRRSLIGALSIAMTALSAGAAQAHGRGWGGGGGRGGRGGGHCFLRGTSIRTPDGEREISTLAIGDLVLTYSGETKPITWIGHRRLEREGDTWNRHDAPIKVMKSALADGVPRADLYVSPGHSLYINGQLIRAGLLVNGQTIVRCSHERDALEYFHLELSDHNLIFAEGMVTETLIPFDRTNFDNSDQEEPAKEPFMSVVWAGGRMLQSRARSAVAPLVDRRTPYDKVRDAIEERAERMKIAA